MSRHIMSAERNRKLATGLSARTERAETALRQAGIDPDKLRGVKALKQASASEIELHGEHKALVSYSTLVAWRCALTGDTFATPRNYYSNTTQRSIDHWCRGARILDESELHKKLADRYA